MIYVLLFLKASIFSFYLYSKEQQSRIEGHVQVRIENYFIIIFIGGLNFLQSICGIYDNIKYINFFKSSIAKSNKMYFAQTSSKSKQFT